MRILLAIHSTLNPKQEQIVKKFLKQDPNTFMIYFGVGRPENDIYLKHFREILTGFGKNIIPVKFELWSGTSVNAQNKFRGYKKSFKGAIDALEKKCKKNERIEVVSFGGASDICYKNINLPAHQLIRKRFGKRITSQRSFLPLMYGNLPKFRKKLSTEPKPKRKKTPRRK